MRWCQNGDFLYPVFPAIGVQHISHLHSKFALGPHHVWKYGRHPICGRWNVSEMSWFSNKYAVSAKTCWVIIMPDDDSTQASWVSKNFLSQQKSPDSAIYAVSATFDLSAQIHGDYSAKYAVSAKIWQVSEMSWLSKKCAVSAETCWVIKMPDDDSTKDSWVSKNMLSQQKISWFGKISCVCKTWLVSTNT